MAYTFEDNGPIGSARLASLTTGSLSAAAIDAQPVQLLLVEDNEDDIMLTNRAFRVAAPHVIVNACKRGLEAAHRASSSQYDVAVIDYMLPDVSGLDLLSSLVSLGLPVIMVTGRGDEKIAVEALKSGAADYLVKDPGYLGRLPQAALVAVERSRLGKENRQLTVQTARQAGLLEAVLNTDPAAIAVLRGPQLCIELTNPSIRKLIPEFEDPEVLGKPLDEVLSRYASTPIRQALDNVYASGEPFHSADMEFPVATGGHRYFRFHLMPLNANASQDNERGLAVIIWETTESMVAKQQIEELAAQAEAQRAWLQTAVDQMPMGVYIASANGDTLLMNRAAIEMFGRPPSNVHDPSLISRYEVTYPDGKEVPMEERPIRRALSKGETVIGHEMRVRTADGQVIDLLTNASPLYDNKGNLIAAISVSQDITRLRDIDRMKDEFMSIASHELRTPLTNMKAAAQLVLRRANQGVYPKQEVSLVKTIVEQSERMTRLIEELLDISRLQTGNLQIQPQPFDLSALAHETVEASRLSNPQFRFELKNDGPTWVNADRDRIAQVLGNLLDNADKYGVENGKAEMVVESASESKVARLTISDNGIGFNPAQSEQIFERFSRLGSIRHHSRGMGLGLFICRQIMAAHGGTITAHSPGPGQGATFTLTLPLYEF